MSASDRMPPPLDVTASPRASEAGKAARSEESPRVDWWIKLKEKMAPPKRKGRGASRDGGQAQTALMALCSQRSHVAFPVVITALSVSGLTIDTSHRLGHDAPVELRVPIGLHFEAEKTGEYVAFQTNVIECRKKPEGPGYEAELRYVEESNQKRDKWVSVVLDTYGFELDDERRREGGPRRQTNLPLRLFTPDGVMMQGKVRNISMGGMLALLDGPVLPKGQQVQVRLGPVHGNDAIEMSAKVVHSMPQEYPFHVIGAAFETLDDGQRTQLIRCLSTLAKDA
jgi:hypothetical protein